MLLMIILAMLLVLLQALFPLVESNLLRWQHELQLATSSQFKPSGAAEEVKNIIRACEK